MPYPDSVNTVMTYVTLGFLALGAAAFLSLWGAVFVLAWETFRQRSRCGCRVREP